MTAKDQMTLRTELLGDVGASRSDAQATRSTGSIADFLAASAISAVPGSHWRKSRKSSGKAGQVSKTKS
ncbi:MAG: hypothetical protein JO143_11400 [Acetobacteraceae bacterium]|nr:hypothetical protein [Acetobacteraceae bacterium]